MFVALQFDPSTHQAPVCLRFEGWFTCTNAEQVASIQLAAVRSVIRLDCTLSKYHFYLNICSAIVLSAIIHFC